MTSLLYTFAGVTRALDFFVNAAASPEPVALTAVSDLNGVIDQLLTAVGQGADDDTFKAQFETHVVTIMESVEALRNTATGSALDSTLNSLLDYFYSAADSIMGGGGDGDAIWPYNRVSLVGY